MANPTLAEMRGALAECGRPSVAFGEAKRLLRDNLPIIIADRNTTLNTQIPVPKKQQFRNAPRNLSDQYIHNVLFKFRRVNQIMAGGWMETKGRLEVFYVMGKLETDEQVDDIWDMVPLIQSVLLSCKTNWYTPEGRGAWNSCVPIEDEIVDAQWPNYSVIVARFELVQGPGLANGWTA